MLDLADLDHLELIAAEVAPQLGGGRPAGYCMGGAVEALWTGSRPAGARCAGDDGSLPATRQPAAVASGRAAPSSAAGGGVAQLVDGHVPAELDGQRGHTGVGDPAGHDAVEPGQVRVAVEREAVHGHAALHPDADGGDLALGAAVVGGQPDAGAPVDPAGARRGPGRCTTAINASSRRRT